MVRTSPPEMSRPARAAGAVGVVEVPGFSLHKINVFILSVSYRYGHRSRTMVVSRCRGMCPPSSICSRDSVFVGCRSLSTV